MQGMISSVAAALRVRSGFRDLAIKQVLTSRQKIGGVYLGTNGDNLVVRLPVLLGSMDEPKIAALIPF